MNHTFGQFVERVYIPAYKGKWKVSRAMTELDRLNHHLVGSLGERAISAITRDELQKLLDRTAKAVSESVVTHLRFRLRSVFDLAVSERAVQRNPASTLYTPKFCKASRTKRVLTPEDLDSMTKALDFREQIILRLATFEGMRPGRSSVFKGVMWTSRKSASGLDVAFTKRTSTRRRATVRQDRLRFRKVRSTC